MKLTRRSSGSLIGIALFDVWEWVVLIRNVADDHEPGHGTAFHLVHYVLAAINLVIAAGLLVFGARGWRSADRPTEHD